MSVLDDFAAALGGRVDEVVLGAGEGVWPRPAEPCPGEHDMVTVKRDGVAVMTVCRRCRRTAYETLTSWSR